MTAPTPDTDRNLLFGVLALQTDLIDAAQFVEACTLWTTRKGLALSDLLVEKGWITTEDKADIQRLVERKLKKHGGDARAGLAAVADDVKRSLAALGDAEIERSLADLPAASGPLRAATVDHIPEVRERYTLTRLHATGGIGRVWLARDANLGRDVALKELRPERADQVGHWARFLREAQVTGQLEHPGIVPVYELARRPDNQQPFYTMRFVKGRTLSEAARTYHQERLAGQDKPLDLLALLNAFVMVCNTIAYAHSRGILHRDLKGHNVILGDFGEVVVLDWGLAKLMERPGTSEADTASVLLDSQEASGEGSGEVDLTVQGQAMGTPAYMAPEQAAGRLDLIDRRTDVYGLGAILYEILTGQPPFTGLDTREVLRKVQQDEPARPGQLWAGVPPALEAACLRALAKQPAGRFATAGELAQEVEQWQEVQRRQAEEALRRQTNILQSILDNMSEGVLVVDADGRLVLSNPAAERLVGIRPSDTSLDEARQRYELYPPDGDKPFPAPEFPLTRALRGEALDEEEVLVRLPQAPGETWLSLNARPLRDEQSGMRGGVVVCRNITKRKQAEEALRQKSALLKLLQVAAVAANEASTLEDALQAVLDQVCAHTGWPVGHAYVLTEDSLDELTPTSIWHLDNPDFYDSFRRVTEVTRLPRGAGLPGRILASGKPTWIMDVTRDPNFPRAKLAENIGVRAAFGFPVLAGTEVVAVLEFFAPGAVEPDEALLEVMGHIGTQLGRVVERQRAAWALRKSEALYHSLVENLPQNIFRKDLTGRFTFGNRRFCATLGKPLEALVGKTDFDFFPPELAQKYRRDDQEVIAGRTTLETTEEHVTPMGEKLYVQVIKTPICASDGTTIGTQGIFWDVTERRQAELALAQERSLLHTLLDNLPDCIYFKDRESRFLRINRALALHFGLTDPAEAVGKTDFDFFTDEHARQAFADEQELMRTGRPVIGLEEKETWPDGHETWVSTTKMPLRDNEGRICGSFGISRDITEKKRTESALAEERNLLRILIDHLPDCIYVKDTQSRFRINNLAHVRVLGATRPEEVAGKTDFDFFPYELAAQYYADEQAIMRSGIPLLNQEQPCVDPRGNQTCMLVIKLPLRDSSSKIVGLVGISRDITERKRAKEEQGPTQGPS
ncbi:MAG: PAS domain-containing protein [Planctomycetes bacterium]|nr:PAS domain-containing protein [Planctomycetota bacterium]